MKKSTRILLVSIISMLIISILIGMVFLFVNQYSSNKAFADYVEDIQTITNVIVDFNQLSQEINIQHDGTFNNDGYLQLGTTYLNSFNSSHYYYIKIYYVVNSGSLDSLQIFNQDYSDYLSNGDKVVTNWSSISLYRATGNRGTNVDFNAYISVIDLTQMFGENNIPNLDQARELFVSDYYPYSLGTAVSYDNLGAWADGYSAAIKSLNVVFSGTLLQSNCFANIGTLYTLSEYNSIGMRIDNTRQLSEFYFNYPTALSKGDVVSLKFENLDINLGDNENNPFSIQIGYYSNGEFIVITSFNPYNSSLDRTYFFEGAYNGVYKNAYVSFNAPENMQRIYFRTTHKGYAIRGLEINAKTSNTAFNLSTAQQRGWDLAKEHYTNYYNEYYSQGGEGYTQIYQAGYQNGNNGGNVFLDSWEWVGSLFTGIGNILTLQIVPGLPLGIFVALPLLVGLIFFIVKISKG